MIKNFYHLLIYFCFLISSFERDIIEAKILKQNVEFCPTPTSLQSLAKIDISIYEILQLHQEFENASYIVDYESSTGTISAVKTKLSLIPSHPFLTLRMLYRLIFDLNHIQSQLITSNQTDILTELNEVVNEANATLGWPGEEYFNEVVMGIIRIHDIYDLDLNKFINGQVLNKQTNYTLQSRHCYSIGKYALELGYYAIAIEWLEIGKSLALLEEDFYQNALSITEELAYAVQMHDYEFDLKPNRFNSQLFVQSLFPYHYKGYVPRLKQRTLDYRNWKGSRNINRRQIDFKGLCVGENFQTNAEKSKLHCKLERNPFFFIHPLRIEVLSLEPYIIQVYNVISDSIINKIKLYSEPRLKRAKIDTNKHTKEYSSYRTALNIWISNDEFPESDAVFTRRIELITGLKLISLDLSEELQVALYNFGGHFDLHVDMSDAMKENGGRMATFMYYLNDVEAGGYTAFPIAGVAAKPVKGSGVFWYNVLSNGQLDSRTYHGACPVILGESKWVANKWIRFQGEYAQCKED